MEARRIADEALEKFAGNAVLRILAGEILMDLGLYEQAERPPRVQR
ncbi:tetratricopeptide repeat protein [Cupriavidus basilensis]